MIGFYHAQMARYTDQNDHASIMNHRRLTAAAYHTAARAYPLDDENHACTSLVPIRRTTMCGC